MNTYKIADLTFNIECSGRTAEQALPYLVPKSDLPDYELKVTNEAAAQFKAKHPDAEITDWEYFLLNLKFCSCLLKENGFVLHSSAVAQGGYAYLFSANSGVGKSTHTSLWQKCFQDAFIINDDKPAIRFIDGKFYVYGTPWSGSSPLNRNVKVPLKAVCFIERGEKNEIEMLTDKAEIFEKIMNQTLRRVGSEKTALLLDTLDRFISSVPFYRLRCLPDENAARLAQSVMSQKN